MNDVLILGGYGNFGKKIAKHLVESGISVIIAGRSEEKVNALMNDLQRQHSEVGVKGSVFDVKTDLRDRIEALNPFIVINVAGPFQGCNYDVAEICVEKKVHYVDLADGREFVVGISSLDEKAKEAGVAVISGASTCPSLCDAVIEKYGKQFSEIDSVTAGISVAQKSEKGLATMAGILGYVGRALKSSFGSVKTRHGWQDVYRQKYPEIGARWMANCDVPDLDLLPKKYGIKDINFSAGVESDVLHFSIWLVSWLVRFGLPMNLAKHVKIFLKISRLFDYFGTENSGMHVIIRGKKLVQSKGEDEDSSKFHEVKWFVVAKNCHGLQIPTFAALIIVKKMLSGKFDYKGASACLGMVSLEEYLLEMSKYNIVVYD